MRSIAVKLAAAALAATLPANAWAAHVAVFAPASMATAAAIGSGGNVGVGIINGVQEPYYGTVGSTTHSADGWTNGASTSVSGNVATSSASLTDGTLHGYAGSTPDGGTFTTSRFTDTVYFTNTSDSALDLTVRFTLDGTVSGVPLDYNGAAGGFSIFTLFNCGGCGNALGQQITFANADHRTADTAAYMLFGPAGIYRFAEYTGISGPPNPADISYGQTFDNGFMTGFYQTTISIPTGLTSLGVGARIDLDCRAGAVCDFGHTGAFTFGDTPGGLSWTSESGSFLTALGPTDPGGGGVPEPATWAMMILGFGLIGTTARSRRRAAATA